LGHISQENAEKKGRVTCPYGVSIEEGGKLESVRQPKRKTPKKSYFLADTDSQSSSWEKLSSPPEKEVRRKSSFPTQNFRLQGGQKGPAGKKNSRQKEEFKERAGRRRMSQGRGGTRASMGLLRLSSTVERPSPQRRCLPKREKHRPMGIRVPPSPRNDGRVTRTKSKETGPGDPDC